MVSLVGEDIWSEAIEETSKNVKLKLGLGVKVFKIIKFGVPWSVDNDYDNASDKYKVDVLRGKDNVKEAKYLVRQLSVKPLYWDNSENDMYTGNIVKTDVSEKVWRRLVKVSYLLKKKQLTQPEYVVYWKRSRVDVLVCFITKAKFEAEEQFIREFHNKIDNDEMDKRFYFCSNKRNVNDELFDDFYKTMWMEDDENE